ncbi:Ankyrin repeat domain-containing protein 22 [Rhizophlyctis rosea]|nr:Ankyrin repeat domain-containing protein 22 [Rhizophlyctis rosea]
MLRDLGGGRASKVVKGVVKGKGGVVRSVGLKEVGLFKACQSGDLDEVYQCMWQNANINCRKPVYGTSPLSEACRNGHIRVTSTLIESGADVSASDGYGVTPLHWASLSANPTLVSYILSKLQSLPTKPPPPPKPPVAPPAEDGERDRYREERRNPYLDLEDKTWIDKRDMFGSTALHFASVMGHEGVVQVLVQAGCDPTIPNNDGRKPSNVTSDESIRAFLTEEEQKTIQARLAMQKQRKLRSASAGKRRKSKSKEGGVKSARKGSRPGSAGSASGKGGMTKSRSKGSVAALGKMSKTKSRSKGSVGKLSVEEGKKTAIVGGGGAAVPATRAKLTDIQTGAGLGSGRPSTAAVRRSAERLGGSTDSLKKSGSGDALGVRASLAGSGEELAKKLTAGPRGFVSAVSGTKGVGV